MEALVLQAQAGPHREESAKALERIAAGGPPLARLIAQIGRAFLDAKPGQMDAFLEKLLSG
jgi:hypothetical protein